ncbi:hypothetical protein C8Q74DRAFT_1204403 [Fomes fomentarius]|nr:hypothetical protein C8Q74DRAFT_1204403 [Fomes fomentarius]
MEPLSRSETLQILIDMGINLPITTKLSASALEKRVRDALNASQNRANIPAQLDPSSLSVWPMLKPWNDASGSAGRSIFDAVRRSSYQEMGEHLLAMRTGQVYAPSPLYTNAFMDVRQTIMGIGKALDNGQRWCLLQDRGGQIFAMNIRFLSVLELDESTPAIVLLYRIYTRADGLEGIKWCQYQYNKVDQRPGDNDIRTIMTTPLEFKLLQELLAMNAKLLPLEYKPRKDLYEEKFRVSVLLPVGPLTFEALGSLNNDTGCVICGKERTSRCSQCQCVSYCGAGCQKADWPAHKTNCRSLKGGQWCTITFRTQMPGYEHCAQEFVSRKGVTHPQTLSTLCIPTSSPPPNVHGDKVFLIKVQAEMDKTTTTILIYDRQRSFKEVYFVEADDPAMHAAVLAEIKGPRGGYDGLKMYRWAKRTGDNLLSVCLDRAPTSPILW